MFLNNLTTLNKEKVRDAVLVELENIGLKNDFPKKTIKHTRRPEGTGRVFRTSLDRLPTAIVPLRSGVEVAVPAFISEACQCVLKNVDVEGIFRKTGSAARQREIKTMLDAGHLVSLSDHHVIDVAGLLKLFFRELPESLVPVKWHDIFVRCLSFGEQMTPAILLTCLLLPPAHLASLAYLMQILHEVASHAAVNKMDRLNLAIILAPTVMPVQIPNRMEKAPAATVRLNNHVQIVQFLIHHAHHIGMVPDYVSGPVGSTLSSSSLTEDTSLRRSLTRSLKKRRRRSASLTRMLNGLRKIVGSRGSPDGTSSDDEVSAPITAPEFSTPCIKSSKKRKAQDVSASGLSTKKKREVLQLLPQSCPLADTPFTPARPPEAASNETPAVSKDPSPTREETSRSPPKPRKKRFFGGRSTSESDKSNKKTLLTMGGKVTKKTKRPDGKEGYGGGFLERSWSAVSNTSSWGRRKLSRLSLLSTSTATNADTDSETLVDADGSGDVGVDLSLSQNATLPSTPASPPVVCLSARQYADIKRRMSDIETRLSAEMKQVLNTSAAAIGSPEPLRAADTAQAVQTVYQRTLEGSERLLDSSADQLARRLGQQLKIRRKSEARVIRSPSARKIGTIRRELRRNKSWHTLQNTGIGSHLRRGKPNTVASGLPQHAPSRVVRPINSTLGTNSPARGAPRPGAGATPDPNTVGLPAFPAPVATPRRASSFHVADTANSFPPPSAKKYSSQVDIAKQAFLSNSTEEMWYDAVERLGRLRPRHLPLIDRRDSVARLRSENAGMVLAKARLFGAATAPPRARPLVSNPPEAKVVASSQMEESTSTPRRLATVDPSSLEQASIRTLRPRPSPPALALESEARRIKKHSSLKVDRAGVTHPVRRNLSTPCHWPDASRDKENRVGKPSPGQSVASPLRDSNRLTSTTPAPAIKAQLGARLTHRIISTPRSGARGRPTPLKALATPLGIPSPRHRSPRVAMGARALLARSRQGRS